VSGPRNRCLAACALLGLLAFAPGCPQRTDPLQWLRPSPETEAVGVLHEVQKGETLRSICRAYGADPQDVAEVNGLEDANKLHIGQRLFIPDATEPREAPQAAGDEGAAEVKQEPGRFVWPVDGVLTSRFGLRGGRRHDGIDLGAPEGTSVRAAAAGQVLYAGEQAGYGLIVIIRHADGFISVYAHNSEYLVREGQQVKQGEPIAKVGRTGRATGPHLHFEIRQGTKPRNPLFFLPRPGS
jgi:lipoprotein NlpD